MSSKDPQLEIAGYSVERLQAGQHTLGYIEIDEDVTVVFRMADDGFPPPDPCLACRISKIAGCKKAVCSEETRGEACRDAIDACTRIACRGECTGSGFGGGGLIIA